MAAGVLVGDLVVVTEDISYHYDSHEDSCVLHKDLQGTVVQISEDFHALVRFPAHVGDRWVLQEDLHLLRPVIDTETAPYADHGDSSAAPPAQGPPPEPVTPAPRLSNPAQFVPVAFLSCTIVFLYCVYVFCHCLPLMQLEEQPEMVDHDARLRGTVQLVVFSVVTLLLVVSYLRAVLTHPGMVPSDDPHWQYHVDANDADKYKPQDLKEAKHTGERRHCKWCHKYKPDRCHHCRVCGTCILKMDHHCPWIYNCVGYHNYKYFFLTLFYAAIALLIIFWSMLESVERSVGDDREPFLTSLLTLFGVTLAASLSLIVMPFGLFHVWLILKALSTIELMEKKKQRPNLKEAAEPLASLSEAGRASAAQRGCGDYTLGELMTGTLSHFDHGVLKNVRAVLGDWAILWLLPVCPPSGSGLSFAQADNPKAEARGMEPRRGTYVRRTSQKKRARHDRRDYWV